MTPGAHDREEPVTEFSVRATNPPLFSVAGVVAIALLLFGLNRLDFLLKALRAQQPSVGNLARLGATGAFVGVMAAFGTNVWLTNSHTVASLIAVGATASAAAVLGGVGASLVPRTSDRR